MTEGVIGREPERAAIERALAAPGPGAVVVAGPAGIGKSILWESTLQAAVRRGHRVLRARTVELESRLSLSGLGDLLDGVHELVLPALPGPQRSALESALVLSDRGSTSELALCAAFLSALRVLSADQPVVLAIDDVQWLDLATAEVLEFATRRLRNEPVLVLMTYRSTAPVAVEDNDFVHGHPQIERVLRLELGPLSFGATRKLLASRSTFTPRLPLARRLHDASEGNPLLTLELAAALAQSAWPTSGTDVLPVPATLDGLLGGRLAAVSRDGQRAVLATALSANPSVELVRAVVDSDAGFEEALAARLVVTDDGSLRLAHPLVGSVVRSRATGAETMELHRRLAALMSDVEEQARHAALGCAPPNEAVADQLAEAAAQAARRGAPTAAAELAEQSWRFTVPGDSRRDDRLVEASELFWRAGEHETGVALLEPELDSLLGTPLWGRARLTMLRLQRLSGGAGALDELLVDAGPRLRAEALLEMSDGVSLSLNTAGGVNTGLSYAQEAFELATTIGDRDLQVRCLTTVAWDKAMLGIDPEPTFAALDGVGPLPESIQLFDDPARVRMLRALWRGEMALARGRLDQLLTATIEQMDEWATVVFTVHLFELAIRVGDWHEVARVHDELAVISAPFSAGPLILRRCRAMRVAIAGDRAAADAAIGELAIKHSYLSSAWHALETIRAGGLAALFARDWEAAASLLGQVVDQVHAVGVGDPGIFPAAPHLIEALIGAGRTAEAEDTLAELEGTARAQSHPWALAAVLRCRGLLAIPAGDEATAMACLESAGSAFSDLGLPFDAARARLDLGSLYRRARRRLDARGELTLALAEFERLGAPLFAARAQAEIDRIGGRNAAIGMTATERQVAGLVLQGLTNQQIADELVVTISTVQAHLTRIYAKNGVRSRAQLISALAAKTDPDLG